MQPLNIQLPLWEVFQRSNTASYGQLVVSARRRVCCYIFKTHFCMFSFLLFISQLLFPSDLLVNNLKEVSNQRNMQFTTLYCGSYIFNSWGVFSRWVGLCHATRLDKKYNQLCFFFSLNLSDSPQWKTSHSALFSVPFFFPSVISCNFFVLLASFWPCL